MSLRRKLSFTEHLFLGSLGSDSRCFGSRFLLDGLLVCRFFVTRFFVSLSSLWSCCCSRFRGWFWCNLCNTGSDLDSCCLCSLQDFDNLLFVDKESTNDALTQAFVAQNTSECSWDGLEAAWHARALTGARWSYSLQLLFALTASWDGTRFLQIQIDQSAARSANTKI